ncbi:hypothetical protein PHJA_001555500 [Phtheirospermum japonicum]|uniref:Peptidase A1 domain-containing protein n=1 Tax=Phtheirospermum japonicum TaxID=374723 RepID=A0A830CI75_9LAMI|nr:hypothetical protein PHJA_001555500 [Phtheirospermum japonicum]
MQIPASPDKEKLNAELKSLCDEVSRTLRETVALLVDFVQSRALLGATLQRKSTEHRRKWADITHCFINSANRFAIHKPYFYQGKPVLFNFLQGGAAVWCIGFQKLRGQGITILGDIVLKDKVVVYDLAGQWIGWANYDCYIQPMLMFSVSTTLVSQETDVIAQYYWCRFLAKKRHPRRYYKRRFKTATNDCFEPPLIVLLLHRFPHRHSGDLYLTSSSLGFGTS